MQRYICTVKVIKETKYITAARRSGLTFWAMFQDVFCVSLIRSMFCDNIATSAIMGKTVKTCFSDAVVYVTSITGLQPDELAEFFPPEYTFTGSVTVKGRLQNYTVRKSRFELYPIVS